MAAWIDKTNLRKQIIIERKNFYLSKIMTGELGPKETEEVVMKVVECNEILFKLSMEEAVN